MESVFKEPEVGSLRYIPFVAIGLFTLIIMIRNVIRNRFSEKESLFWTVAGLIMVASPFYMGYVDRFSNMLGVTYAPSLIFALLFVFVFFLLYRLSATIHRLNERLVELIQLNAIYENELRTLKKRFEDIDYGIVKDS
jgi:hypothetical protein